MKKKNIIKMLVKWCDQLEDRIWVLEKTPHCSSAAADPAAPPARPARPAPAEPKGLGALFDQKPNGIPMYRHKCDACKRVLVNKLSTDHKCCGTMMRTTKVKRRG